MITDIATQEWQIAQIMSAMKFIFMLMLGAFVLNTVLNVVLPPLQAKYPKFNDWLNRS